MSLALFVVLLSGQVWAAPRHTHAALAELFFPAGPRFETLVEESWGPAQAEFPAAVWAQLAPLAQLAPKERSLALTQLREAPETAPLHLLVRRFYLGWFYSGERGRRFASLPPTQFTEGTPSQPEFAPSPLKLSDDTIHWTGGEIDYLIIGSGPAGSVLGYELSRAGFRTVLVERGSFVLPDIVDTRVVPQLKVGNGAVPTLDASVLVRNGSTVGGGSTVNVDLAFAPTLPFVQSKIEQWRRAGQIGPQQWSPADMERAYAWVVEQVGTRQPGLEELNGNNAVLWDGARATGLNPQLYGLNTVPHQPEHLNKKSAVKTLLLEAMTWPDNPLVVIPDLSVTTLICEQGTALGARAVKKAPWQHPSVLADPAKLELVNDQSYQLEARNVILCAGAEGTAGILLRSQLGGPEVGRGVVLHPSIPLIGLFSRPINALTGTASTVYVVDNQDQKGVLYECMTDGPAYVAMMLFGRGQEVAERVQRFNNLSGFGVLLVDSVIDSNHIVLNPQGEPRVNYTLSASDKSRLRQGLVKAVRMMLAAGASEVYLPSCELSDPTQSPDQLVAFRSEQDLAKISAINFLPARTVVTSAHMQSTCKMGSVVDRQHRLKGFDNLYLCDSSVFPTSVGANPMQTIYTVAKLFAEQLITSRTSGGAESQRPRARGHRPRDKAPAFQR